MARKKAASTVEPLKMWKRGPALRGRVGQMQRGCGKKHAYEEGERHFPADDAAQGQIHAAEKERAGLRGSETAELPAEQQVGKREVRHGRAAEVLGLEQGIDERGVQHRGRGIHVEREGNEHQGPAHEGGVDLVGAVAAEGHAAYAHGARRGNDHEPPRGGNGQQKGEQQAGNGGGAVVLAELLLHERLADGFGDE